MSASELSPMSPGAARSVRILRRGDGKRAVLYEVIARETREERVADRRRAPPDAARKAERIEATLALFDSHPPSPKVERDEGKSGNGT